MNFKKYKKKISRIQLLIIMIEMSSKFYDFIWIENIIKIEELYFLNYFFCNFHIVPILYNRNEPQSKNLFSYKSYLFILLNIITNIFLFTSYFISRCFIEGRYRHKTKEINYKCKVHLNEIPFSTAGNIHGREG